MASMTTPSASPARAETAADLDFDTIVIGAGISGLYQLHRLREIGQRVRVLEAGMRSLRSGGARVSYRPAPEAARA